MKSSTNPIRFESPPVGFSISTGHEAKPEADRASGVSLEQMEAACEEAYLRGVSEGTAQVLAELQEHRDALGMLQSITLQNLAEQHAELVQQVGVLLPGLALEIARRIFTTFEPTADQVEVLVKEVLGEISPGGGEIEVWLSPRDLELVVDITPELQMHHPGIRILSDSDLVPGDCRARSRFGAVDARLATKRSNIARSLGA